MNSPFRIFPRHCVHRKVPVTGSSSSSCVGLFTKQRVDVLIGVCFGPSISLFSLLIQCHIENGVVALSGVSYCNTHLYRLQNFNHFWQVCWKEFITDKIFCTLSCCLLFSGFTVEQDAMMLSMTMTMNSTSFYMNTQLMTYTSPT